MSDHSGDSVSLSVSTQPYSSPPATDRQRSDIQSWFTTSVKEALLAVPYSLKQIWKPLVCHVGETVAGIKLIMTLNCHNPWIIIIVMALLVPHMILCLIMTSLLPISLLRKLVFTEGKLPLTWGKILLVISCIALAVDPLFLYIPFIDEKSKCIGMDKKLRAVVLALRLLTDLAFAFRIDAKIHDRTSQYDEDDFIDRCFCWLSPDIIIEVLPVLPIPQVIIVTTFFRMAGSGYRYKIAICNVFLILQFILRGWQIYRFKKLFTRIDKWTKSAFYFLLYIEAGHVLGAFWYFWSIQQEISCWHQTCKNAKDCLAINYCKNTNYSTNITLLDEFCPINPSNATVYDFGLFLQALQSGNTGSTSFSTKFFYTLWWGIKNLSNFGTSLETSNYLWENCFAILISLVGLLLFLYLMGNVQTYILWETTKALEYKEHKIKSKYEDLDRWMVRNGIPEQVKTEAVNHIREKKVVEKNYDADVDLVFVVNALPADICWKLRLHFWKHLDECGIYAHDLEPVVYKEDSHVPNDVIFLIITEGVIELQRNERFEKYEVIYQRLPINRNQGIPKSSQDVKCVTKVEALALSWTRFRHDFEFFTVYYGRLKASAKKFRQQKKNILEWLQSTNNVPEDLQTLVMEVMEHVRAQDNLKEYLEAEVDVKYLFSIGLSSDVEFRIKKTTCIPSLKKVPVLERVNEDILDRICKFLEPLVLLEHSCIFNPDSPVDRMLIVIEGEITVTKVIGNDGSTVIPTVSELTVTERGEVERIITKGEVIGEELLTCAIPTVSESSNSNPAIMKKYVCSTKVEAFVLTKKGLESVIASFGDGINKFEQLVNGDVADIKCVSTALATTNQRLEQLIQLQRDMVQQQGSQGRRLDEMVQQQGIIREEMANQGRRLDEMATFLSRLGYPGGTYSPPAA